MIARRIFIIMVIMAMMALWSGDILAYVSLGSPTKVTGQGTVPITPGPILDNFSADSALNKWNGATGVFGSILTETTNPGYCTRSWDPSAQAIRLDYDVRNVKSYSGYSSKMGGGSLNGYLSVSFWVKGTKGGEIFKAEFKAKLATADPDRDHAAVYVTAYLDAGVSATEWRQVTIPLNNFANISDWSSISEFAITFENSQSSVTGAPLQSAIYIDNIVFNTSAPPLIRIGYFNDKIPIDSLGGNLWAGSSGGGATASFLFQPDAGPLLTGKNSLRFDFVGLSDSTKWAAVSFPVGGGADGIKKIAHNFGAYSAISFYIRGSNAVNGVKVELHDFKGQGAGEPFFLIPYSGNISDTFGAFGTGWKKYRIPFSSFKNFSGVGLDFTRIAEIAFSVDYWNSPVLDLTFNIMYVQFE